MREDAFSSYMHAKDRREAAYQRYNSASHWLELETIKERLAEIESQHEPLASLLTAPLGERERLFAAAYYVVVGRMPTPSTPNAPNEAAAASVWAESQKEGR